MYPWPLSRYGGIGALLGGFRSRLCRSRCGLHSSQLTVVDYASGNNGQERRSANANRDPLGGTNPPLARYEIRNRPATYIAIMVCIIAWGALFSGLIYWGYGPAGLGLVLFILGLALAAYATHLALTGQFVPTRFLYSAGYQVQETGEHEHAYPSR
jgi:hypothetical protein